MADIVSDQSPTAAQHSEFWRQVDKGLVNKKNFQNFLEEKKCILSNKKSLYEVYSSLRKALNDPLLKHHSIDLFSLPYLENPENETNWIDNPRFLTVNKDLASRTIMLKFEDLTKFSIIQAIELCTRMVTKENMLSDVELIVPLSTKFISGDSPVIRFFRINEEYHLQFYQNHPHRIGSDKLVVFS